MPHYIVIEVGKALWPTRWMELEIQKLIDRHAPLIGYSLKVLTEFEAHATLVGRAGG